MYGVWIHEGNVAKRPTSKKQVKEHLAAGKDIGLESTSMFGNEFSGILTKEVIETYGDVYFVGPNPYEKRNFYGKFKINKKGMVTCE